MDYYTIIITEAKLVLDYMKSKFDDFPIGYCNVTSQILGYTLMYHHDLKATSVITGRMKNNNDQTHAWLTKSEYVIDLTLSQFNEKYGYDFDDIY